MKRFTAAFVLMLGCAGLGAQSPETVNICDRTNAIENRILAAIPGDDCMAVLTSELRTITDLDLRSRGINSLQTGDFSGLTGLQSLNIENNIIEALPRDIFSELINLQTLDLTGIRLTGLPADVFSRLTNLRTLDLASNRFASLPANVFSGLTNLRTLDLIASFAQNFSLPANIFSRLTNLRTLRLNDNANLLRLPVNAFSGLTKLQTLNLGYSGLTALQSNIFSGLTNLAEVRLIDNPGSDFNLWVRPEIEPLQLSGDPNRTSAKLVLRKGAPRPITVAVSTTEGATLSTDSLTIPTGGVESSLVTITRTSEATPFELILGEITLGGNNNQYEGFQIVPGPPIDESIIDICDRTGEVQAAILAVVDTDDCEIVPSSELMTVTELNLAGQSGQLLLRPDDFSGLTGLQALDLSNSFLEVLPPNIFSRLTGLQTLDLSGNFITTLPDDIFSKLSSLRVLDLSDHVILMLPAGIFLGLTSLARVNLHTGFRLPFDLIVRPEFELSDDSVSATVKLVLPEGAPRPITVALSTTEGATLSSGSLTIPTGNVESGIVTMTRTLDSPPFELTLGEITLGGNDDQYTGIQIVTGEPLEGPTINICDRTEAV